MSGRARSEDWFSVFPFSWLGREREIHEIGKELLCALGLEGQVNLLETDADGALSLEAWFRRGWWSGKADAFRDAVHALKFRAMSVASRGAMVTEKWREMSEHVQSDLWRAHIQALLKDETAERREYLRLAFGAGRQVWTRAARWRAAFPGEPNPFSAMIRLFEISCWPLGWKEGKLQLCRCGGGNLGEVLPEIQENQRGGEAQAKIVFVSAPFREAANARLIQAVAEHGWTPVHGPVDEKFPPEQQLGARIRSAAATVGFISAVDPDFSIPWWMYQEMDFARACNLPCALVVGEMPSEAKGDFPLFTMHNDTIEDRFWRWLDGCSSLL